ncbi:MAG: hypothetical protein IJ080_08925 [Oscillospiraceae bacterium]|nr:hypothetical protein [Oscillospiraceae bacterium]MBQ8979857.1 hypothetical protein [Oscillospiraceae bacterium]
MDEEMNNETLAQENMKLREQLFLAKENIPDEYCEDLAVLARARMGEGICFEDAAREVIEKYRGTFRPAGGVAMQPARDDDSEIRRAFGLR